MESKALNIALNAVKFGIILIGIIFLGMILGGNNDYVGGALQLGYIAFFIAAAGSILFSIALFLIHIKRSIRALIGIGLFAIAMLIAYNMASSEVLMSWQDMSNATPDISKWVGGGIISLYILLAATVLTIIVNEVVTLLK